MANERIDEIQYAAPVNPSTREPLETDLFLTGPAEFLCQQIAVKLLADPVWSRLFGEFIDPYKRMDYSIRSLPALRIYNNGYRKDYESWFINGNVTLDIIFPPNIRRVEVEQIPESVSAAMLQQFRRPTFFGNLIEVIPGLNELGKIVDVDKALAFDFEDELAPLVQMMVNFKIDLRDWDRYMENDYRTLDEPFSRPLGDLTRIITTIEALRDDGQKELDLDADQVITHVP